MTKEQTGQEVLIDRTEWLKRWDEWRAHIASGGVASWPRDAFESLLDEFDAKLAQVRQEAWVAERAAEVEARDRDEWKAKAIAAEAKLDAIRRRVEGLHEFVRSSFTGRQTNREEAFVESWHSHKDEILALLQPQSQSDTSGLPG